MLHNGHMAERVEQPEGIRDQAPNYPWDEWGDGAWWRCTWGRDFVCSVPGFRASVYQNARARGRAAQTRVEGHSVIFRFVPKED